MNLNDYDCLVTYCQRVVVTDRSLFHRLGLSLGNDNELRDIHWVHFAYICARKIRDSVIDGTVLLAFEADVGRVVDGHCWHAVDHNIELRQQKRHAITEPEVNPFATHVDITIFEGIDSRCERLLDA